MTCHAAGSRGGGRDRKGCRLLTWFEAVAHSALSQTRTIRGEDQAEARAGLGPGITSICRFPSPP